MKKALVTMVVTVAVQGLMMLGFIAINEGPRAVLAYGALVATIYGLIAKFWGFRNRLKYSADTRLAR